MGLLSMAMLIKTIDLIYCVSSPDDVFASNLYGVMFHQWFAELGQPQHFDVKNHRHMAL